MLCGNKAYVIQAINHAAVFGTGKVRMVFRDGVKDELAYTCNLGLWRPSFWRVFALDQSTGTVHLQCGAYSLGLLLPIAEDSFNERIS